MLRKLLDAGVPKNKAEERVRKMVEVFMKKHNPESSPDSDGEE